MATLHVAMCRRIGWPVGLACARAHLISRFDDGQVLHNIEATSTHPGSFNSEPDEFYVEKFKLSKRAIECGSDMRKLTSREMLGIFLTARGRHFRDTGRMRRAELDYGLSRVIFPAHRWTYIDAMAAMIDRGTDLFERGELGHPDSLFEDLSPKLAPNVWNSLQPGIAPDKIRGSQPFVYRDVYLPMPGFGQPNHNGKEIRR